MDGIPLGYGKIYNEHFLEYEGDLNYSRHGKGTMVMANGDVFEGEWEKGLRKKGKVIKSDGSVIEETYDVEKDLQNQNTPD